MAIEYMAMLWELGPIVSYVGRLVPMVLSSLEILDPAQ